MKDYLISEAQVVVGDGGMSCGPVDGPIVGEAKFTDEDGKYFYLSLAEVMGIPNFFKTPESTIEKQAKMLDDEEFWKKMNNEYYLDLGEYTEILADDYDGTTDLYRYLIYLVRSDWDDAEDFIKNTNGKHFSEIEIPASDIEEEMMEEEYWEEDDDDEDDDSDEYTEEELMKFKNR